MTLRALKTLPRLCKGGAYFRPRNFRVAVGQIFDANRNLRTFSERDHLLKAAGWLKRAQDSTSDGGFAGRYNLRNGWSSSYPETTGYIIPTLLKLADELHDGEYVERARRAIDFLLSVQLPSGAFPGGEIADNSTEPSPFNTAQIMHGLQCWVQRTKDERCRTALQRAGAWLCKIQDPSGAWRKFFYMGLATTYSAHLTCWLAEAGAFLGDDRMLAASSRHLTWVLQQYDAKHAWFDLCGFSQDDHDARRAVTHTIAYTLWGVLRTAEVLGSAEGKAAAEQAAYAALRRLELSRRLAGVLNHEWRPVASFDCLTGNAQMALIWLHIYEERGDGRFLNAALKAIDLVKAAQVMDGEDPGVIGGISGSRPIWGDYIQHSFPNWAAKYFIDALLAKQRILKKKTPVRNDGITIRELGPTALPPKDGSNPDTRPKIALLTSEFSSKVMDFYAAWSKWGFRPDFVLIERTPTRPFWSRVRGRLSRSLMEVPRRYDSPQDAEDNEDHPKVSVLHFCNQTGIPVNEVDSVNSAEAVRLLQARKIDLVVHAGAGILKKPLIGAVSLGVLNAHMGLLPFYRGMNVAEWAAWNGDPVGCSVHLIDTGIDTGDILLVREVAISAAQSVRELRNLVNQNQVDLLGKVVRYVLETGRLPPRHGQTQAEGLQYFTMHSTLIQELEGRLARRPKTALVHAEPRP